MKRLDQILHHHLGVWKSMARWVPHQLTKEQRKGKVEWCLHRLENMTEAESKLHSSV